MKLDPPPSRVELAKESKADFIWKNWLNSLFEFVTKTEIRSFATKTAAYTAGKETVLLVNTSGGAITITLPPAASNEGLCLYIKDIDSGVNAVTIDGNGAETIDGALTLVLASARGTAKLFCDGSQWHRLSN
jgi:hypothetical protein